MVGPVVGMVGPGGQRETPTGVGCALRVLDNFDCGGGQGSGRQKNPHRGGEVFASTVAPTGSPLLYHA
jgi:hypothetical protein